MAWAGEVEKLKNCDYILVTAPGIAPAIFIAEFRARGYAAKFLGTAAMSAFLGLYVDKCGGRLLMER